MNTCPTYHTIEILHNSLWLFLHNNSVRLVLNKLYILNAVCLWDSTSQNVVIVEYSIWCLCLFVFVYVVEIVRSCYLTSVKMSFVNNH